MPAPRPSGLALLSARAADTAVRAYCVKYTKHVKRTELLGIDSGTCMHTDSAHPKNSRCRQCRLIQEQHSRGCCADGLEVAAYTWQQLRAWLVVLPSQLSHRYHDKGWCQVTAQESSSSEQ